MYNLEDKSEYKRKSIIVTDTGGFIGSHLTEYLIEKGHKVKAFARYNFRDFLGKAKEKSKSIENKSPFHKYLIFSLNFYKRIGIYRYNKNIKKEEAKNI